MIVPMGRPIYERKMVLEQRQMPDAVERRAAGDYDPDLTTPYPF
jgi:hypothetical protein